MSPYKIPSLGYALLGLLQQKPSSGYDLRKIFSSTALKTYSDSPGAIYPALRRLEQQALIHGTVEKRSGLRHRQIFRLTPQGATALKKWIARPITREDVIWGGQEILLRFAFSEKAAGQPVAVELLKSLETALCGYLPELRAQLEALRPVLPRSSRLAFECGIRGNESFLEWTRYAKAAYESDLRK